MNRRNDQKPGGVNFFLFSDVSGAGEALLNSSYLAFPGAEEIFKEAEMNRGTHLHKDLEDLKRLEDQILQGTEEYDDSLTREQMAEESLAWVIGLFTRTMPMSATPET